jgi:hyperosmotically inducible protein
MALIWRHRCSASGIVHDNKTGTGVMKQQRLAAVLLVALALGTAAGCAGGGARTQAVAEHRDDDASITAGVKSAIGKEKDLQASDIQVETKKGIVQLSGFVRSTDEIATVASVARTVKGVKSIKNDLRLK